MRLNMEKFKALIKTELNLELENSEELDRLYAIIDSEENFILQWTVDKKVYSEVIITTNIASKVKTGELKLTSKEDVEE
jgi:hypothetical protein